MRPAFPLAAIAARLATLLALGAAAGVSPVCASDPRVPIEHEWHYAVVELMRLGLSIDTEGLIELATSHEDPLIRWKAVSVLGGRRERSGTEAIRGILIDDDAFEVRRQAARALWRLGESDGSEALRTMMESPDTLSNERISIAGELAESGDLTGFVHIERGLESTDPVIRLEAAHSLVAFLRPALDGGLRADPCALLAGLARDDAVAVRRHAVELFHRAVVEGCDAGVFESVMETLAAGDADEEVRDSAARTLRRLRELRNKEKAGKEKP